MLTACGDSTELVEVETPAPPSTEINRVNISIEVYQETVDEKLAEIEALKSDDADTYLIETQEQLLESAQERLIDYKNQLSKLENTLVYNDTLSVVNGNAIFIDTHESILTESTFVSGFARDMSKLLASYKDEFTGDAIFIAAVPYGGSEDKTPVIGVKYNADTLKEVDYTDLIEDEDYFYNNADIVWRHNDLSGELSEIGTHIEDDLLIEYYWTTY